MTMPSSHSNNRPPQNRNIPARPQQQATQRQDPPSESPFTILRGDLERNRPIYSALLATDKPAPQAKIDRFIVACYQHVWNKPDLLDADRDSLLLAFAEAACVDLDLNPTAKECFIEVRSGHARFATQYLGLVKLMYRSNDVDFIHCDVVRRGDHFRKIGGSTPRIEHEACPLGQEPDDYDTDDAILASYAVVQIRGASLPQFEVARRSDFMRAKGMSKGSTWDKWMDRMAIKLPLRRLTNRLPGADAAREMLSIEDGREDGKSLTLGRVASMLGDTVKAGPTLEPARGRDDLRELMEASGPRLRPNSEPEHASPDASAPTNSSGS
jgi:recombinational DNA repair protein RecT